MKLYEISNELRNLIEYGNVWVSEETGEVFNKEQVDALNLEFEKKIDGCAVIYKELLAEAEATEKEAKELTARAKAKRNRAENLKQYIAENLHGEKFENGHTRISYRKSKGLVIDDEDEIPEEYIIKTVHETVNKTDLTNDIKNGAVIPGCHLEERNNIQVK